VGGGDVIRIEPVSVGVVLPLRSQVLRPGLPLAESNYAEDLDASTLHLAALDEGGEVVGCSTWFPEDWQGRPAWRLRGMATSPSVRGTGVGGALLHRGLAAAAQVGVGEVWANARTIALGFYRRYGFETVGEEFLTAHAIPHYVIWRSLADGGQASELTSQQASEQASEQGVGGQT
jgi:predicted GNAT family N-acyltransferase